MDLGNRETCIIFLQHSKRSPLRGISRTDNDEATKQQPARVDGLPVDAKKMTLEDISDLHSLRSIIYASPRSHFDESSIVSQLHRIVKSLTLKFYN